MTSPLPTPLETLHAYHQPIAWSNFLLLESTTGFSLRVNVEAMSPDDTVSLRRCRVIGESLRDRLRREFGAIRLRNRNKTLSVEIPAGMDRDTARDLIIEACYRTHPFWYKHFWAVANTPEGWKAGEVLRRRIRLSASESLLIAISQLARDWCLTHKLITTDCIRRSRDEHWWSACKPGGGPSAMKLRQAPGGRIILVLNGERKYFFVSWETDECITLTSSTSGDFGYATWEVFALEDKPALVRRILELCVEAFTAPVTDAPVPKETPA
jgi:hypothetical protein